MSLTPDQESGRQLNVCEFSRKKSDTFQQRLKLEGYNHITGNNFQYNMAPVSKEGLLWILL
jgi:hypothetical protein